MTTRNLIPIALALALAGLPATSLAADPPTAKPPDYAREVPRLEAQVLRGDADAMETLGEYYAAGLGVTRNLVHACDLFEGAANKTLPEAQHNFANCWFYGLGRQRDYARSADWYQRAMKQGFLRSFCALGVQYRFGLGVPADKAHAFELCTKGAEHDDPDTLGELGEMYLAGDGTPRDVAKAIDVLKRAAEQKQANAARLLGLIYFNGDGVARDPNQARDWLMQAADAGRRDAFLPLGKLFFAASGDLAARKLNNGIAAPALFWLTLAIEYEPEAERRTEAKKLYDQLAPLAPQLVKQIEPDLKPWRDSLGKP
jgi:TPR repeat protein